jgi:electron transfer flavoprotein-quinone oxidoreductase
MISSQYDVLVVGAGCAGLTAAIGLARADFRVAVVEAAPFPGAASWSGCVYDTRHLAHPDILGPEGVEQLVWERRLVERGRFLSDGLRLLGTTYRDPEAFGHVYLVLRPVFDHSLAQAAARHGASLLCGTTVESLIREEGRVIGACTQRGPLYADLVFLAEGDASHLIAREGYEQSNDPRDAPRFLHAIKQVIELPPGAVEERFGVGPEQGVAHDFLLRNGSVNGQVVPLNMTGFVCTSRQSLSVGLMLPAEHLRAFAGSSPRLLAWLLEQPALRPWWKDGRPGALGARLIRAGGGPVPYLADEGLAVGGAASGIGTRLPVLDFIGPATLTGLLLVQAACRIRAEGGGFTREQLGRHYLEPLRQSACWKDTVVLQRWPGYLRRSRVLFTRSLDLALDTAEVWTSRRWLMLKLFSWCRLLAGPGWGGWSEVHDDLRLLGWALRLRARLAWPGLSWALFNGYLNSLRDLLRRPRAGLPEGGQLRLHYRTAGAVMPGRPPWFLRRWYGRFRPSLEAAARLVYRTEPAPFADKLGAAVRLLVQQLNLFDLMAAALLALFSAVGSVLLALARTLLALILRRPRHALAAVTPTYDGVGGTLLVAADSGVDTNPGIHLLWPRGLPDYHTLLEQGLERVCPTRVFDVRASSGAVQVQVHAQRCIQCETCWRVSPVVDWGRDVRRSLIYPVLSPVVTRLLHAQEAAGLARPALPHCNDPWRQAAAATTAIDETARTSLSAALDQLEHKLEEFDRALEHESALVDRARAEHLEMLARYAHHLARDVLALVQTGGLAEGTPVLSLARALVSGAEERMQRAWEGRLAWAAANGRQLRQHHLAGLRNLLSIAPPSAVTASALPTAGPRTSDVLESLWRLVHTIEPGRTEHATALGCLVAAVAARRLLLEALTLPAQAREGEAALREQLLQALAADLRASTACYLREMQELTASPQQEVLDRLGQQLAGEGPTGSAHVKAITAFGEQLLAGEMPLHVRLQQISGQEGAYRGRALPAELEEIQRAQERLAALAQEWEGQLDTAGDGADAEVADRMGRQALAVLGGKLLVAWIERRLEQGGDTELDAVLLRVWLDEREVSLSAFASFLRRRVQGIPWPGDRPLVEPDLPPPERSLTDFLAAPPAYDSGDFLLAPVDLRHARLVPEMLTDPQQLREILQPSEHGSAKNSLEQRDTGLLQLLEQLEALRPAPERPWWPAHAELTHFLASAVVCTLVGRVRQSPAAALGLEEACGEVVVRELLLEGDRLAGARQGGGSPPTSVHGQLAVLHGLVSCVLPRWDRKPPPPRHLGREALELEALKAAWRQSVSRAGDVFQSGRWENPTVQVSCLAVAAATAWLFAADSVLGRLAWLDRAHADEDSPAPGRPAGLQALARCHATVRDALHRFGEDLAALRRGYVAPHLRVPPLLRQATPAPAASPPSHIRRPLRVLVFLEPRPAVLATAEGEQVLETYWALGGSDRAALETALRLRDAAPGQVRLQAAALGPRRIGPLLREVHSLQIERVDLLLHDTDMGSDGAAAALAGYLRRQGPFDLLLAGDSPVPSDRHLAQRLAEALGLPLAGHAARLVVREDQIVLCGPDGQAVQERALPAAVLVRPGLPLRPFTTAGYLQGLVHSPVVHES